VPAYDPAAALRLFESKTRLKWAPALQTQSKPAGGGTVSWVVPRVGFAARFFLAIRGSIAGTLSAPNAQGMASIVKTIRLQANAGTDVFSVSGPGYHWLLRDMFELGNDILPQSTARNAVTATSFNLDVVIPLQINERDFVGLVNLQTEQTTMILSVTFEQDATVATGATVTATVTPYLSFFTVPSDAGAAPPDNVIHQIIEEQTPISATGQYPYSWLRGNVYLQMIHGFGFGVSGADNFNRVQLRVNQTDFIFDADVNLLDMMRSSQSLSQRRAGVVPIDLIGQSGLGNYDKWRDAIPSGQVTDLASVFTFTSTGTLYSIRRMISPLR